MRCRSWPRSSPAAAGSRLNQALVLDKKLALTVGAGYGPSALGLADFGVYATPKPGVAVADLEAALAAELHRLLEHGVEPAEVARAAKRMQAAAIYSQGQPLRPGQHHRHRAGESAAASTTSPPGRSHRRGDPAEVEAAARASWSSAIPRPVSCCRSAPHEAAQYRARAENYAGECRHPPSCSRRRPGSTAIMDTGLRGKTRKGRRVAQIAVRDANAGDAGALGRIARPLAWGGTAAAMQIQPVTGAKRRRGLAVEDHSVPVVSIRFAFPGGAALDPAGKGGTASMVASCSMRAPAPMTPSRFTAASTISPASCGFPRRRTGSNGSLRSLKQNLSESAELLRLALAEPRLFAPDAIERIRAETLAGLARQAKNPRSLSGRLWMYDAFEKQSLWQRHRRQPRPRVTAINPRRSRRVRRRAFASRRSDDWRCRRYRQGRGGRVARSGVRRFCRSASPRARSPTRSRSMTRASSSARAAGAAKASYLWPAGPKRDDPAWYAAYVLNDILGGGGFRGRLMKEITREARPAYGV